MSGQDLGALLGDFLAEAEERTARVEFVKALVALRNAQGLLGEEDGE